MQANAPSRKKIFINAAIFILMTTLGITGYMFFMNSKPKVAKKPPVKKVLTVTTAHIKKGSVPLQIQGTGTVIPAQQIELKPEVTGTVVWISPQFAAGGVIKKGEPVLRIDTSDYEIALRKSISALDTAKAELMLEEGQQRVAKESVRLLDANKKSPKYSTELALRKPQLMKAKAGLEKAQAEVEQAKLNLSRCELRAPFDVLVQKTGVNLGSRVTASSTLATLVGIEEYWIEAAIPVDRLEQLGLHRDTITATVVRQGGSSSWEGTVLRLTGTLTESTRLARVVVSVKDPLRLASKNFSTPLMLGDYVDVNIQGKTIESVYKIPRDFVRNENQVWIYANGTLQVRDLAVVWKSPEAVYASTGIAESDAVITSYLSNAYSGMTLALESTTTPNVASQPVKQTHPAKSVPSGKRSSNGNNVATAE
ncbi:efflux RND transporter periplasmic adaptor subunit [Halodesulfovibrio sp.]|jgi:RND family efflux transporter MFP subunit|uniref:efflux RND transporter periplasmic adaptor subunit n=1 Tax=Halodesulfovibrio sp. TaxID=1912772 RepID=UPI0025FCD10E|nr:efflux RND transporter periplasmic adaptor subunit [Halodesulfovibrio sp.]MCT4625545.1 efflux RND transporter periplasmic adaptor subunit [Halodesulfovibrio sp.]